MEFCRKRVPIGLTLGRKAPVVGLPVVAEDTVQHLQREVAVLDALQEPDALDVVMEPPDPVFPAEFVEVPLPEVAVWCVTDVVTESDRLDQVFVQAESPADRPPDL